MEKKVVYPDVFCRADSVAIVEQKQHGPHSMLGCGSLLHPLQHQHSELTCTLGIANCIQHSFYGFILAFQDLHNSISEWVAKTAKTAHGNEQNYQQPQFILSEFPQSLVNFFTCISRQMCTCYTQQHQTVFYIHLLRFIDQRSLNRIHACNCLLAQNLP